MANRYLTENLDALIELRDMMREAHGKFISELIHSSFFLAVDFDMNPLRLSIDGDDYAFIFSTPDEFDKVYPNEDVPAMEVELSALIDILEPYRLDGLILNVSSQNFCMTKTFLEGLNDLPSCVICSSNAYSSQELKVLKDSLDNHDFENFIRTCDNHMEFFEMMSSRVLFAAVESDKDMDILEQGGIVDTFGLDHKYDYYSQNGHVSLFTSEDKVKNIKTSKFKYLALVNFATFVHYAIMNEFEGIAVNPDDENYTVPIDVLISNWGLINRTCWDEKLVYASNTLFSI